ncbi:ribosome biogenesis GTP-binding protein YihA/YsxC [Desulfatitalea alkaliphila]|uniref:Probable GTP-binding protein EngB n=1 Tax=Desulfatitalea alkaliphila TaxID=2929485 RepID=A0AA41QZN4_9BACT|nr:ribosome biogenesis GTP-binding protein YihA/YsxC [Desulfatitalea alkaliphila]MCJ8499279.1 ribosome biogenesis GTP-binding protein YihA/YsxC [Desulfatitalea alkaliphila]
MIIKSAEFITSAVQPAHYPPPDHPEIAFAGRSNVGKSSLINTLVRRKRLVKTSSTPGRTQLINFFLINGDLMLVDLPGYGYAKVPAAVRKQWGPMVETYVARRTSLKGAVVLVDARRRPEVEELNLIDWLRQHRVAVVPVLTKADKLSKTELIKQRRAAAQALDMAEEALILFSAKSRLGKEALWQRLEGILAHTDDT